MIITQGSESAQAARRATTSIPIVFAGPSYPVEEGLVASFARPAGNVTGFTVAMSDTVSKHLQLLRDMVPTLDNVAVIWTPANQGHRFAFRDTESVASSLRLTVHSVPMASVDDVDLALAQVARLKPGALIVWPTAALADDQVRRIGEVTVRLRIPSITTLKSLARQGLLMSYGPDTSDAPRRIADYVDRILKGAKPADLPVVRPTKFELVINRNTAKAIGLTIPQALLLRADQIVE